MFQYLRVYPKTSLTYRLSLYTLIFTAIWGAVYSFMAWFPCFPVYHVWIQDPVSSDIASLAERVRGHVDGVAPGVCKADGPSAN